MMCSVEGCRLEKFENKDKCILHCEKDNWNENNKEEKINLFWYEIRKKILYINRRLQTYERKINKRKSKNFIEIKFHYKFENINFPRFKLKGPLIDQSFKSLKNLNLIFKNCKFYEDANFVNLNDSANIEIFNCVFNKNVFLDRHIFTNSFKLKYSIIRGFAKFYNTKFEKIADFSGTIFYKTDFKTLKFNDLAIFKNTIFMENIDFKYSVFHDKSIFINAVFKKKLNLKNTIFKENGNFLDISPNLEKITEQQLSDDDIIYNQIYYDEIIKDKFDNNFLFSNKETARIIKDSFEQKNNIIEANKYYALEMKERDKELTWKENFFDKLVFKFHGLSSNHSQNWLLPIFWIFFFGLFYSYFQLLDFYTFDKIDFIAKEFFLGVNVSIISFILMLSLIKHKWFYNYISSFFLMIMVYLNKTNDLYLKEFANCINPFSVMTKGEPLTFGSLLFKIIIAYLIYQLIISIRQNTRRK